MTVTVPFDQRLARVVVRPLAHTPVTPNFLTLLSLIVGLAAACLMAQGDAALANWGAGLFVIAAWMDHLDGELARLTDRTSEFGHYFDHAAAVTNYAAFFIGAGIGLRGGMLGDWAVPLGIAAGIAIAAIFSVRLWVELRDGRTAVKQTVRGGFEIEDTLYIAGPVTWLGGLAPFTAAAGIGAPLFLIWVIWQAFRQDRKRGDSGPD